MPSLLGSFSNLGKTHQSSSPWKDPLILQTCFYSQALLTSTFHSKRFTRLPNLMHQITVWLLSPGHRDHRSTQLRMTVKTVFLLVTPYIELLVREDWLQSSIEWVRTQASRSSPVWASLGTGLTLWVPFLGWTTKEKQGDLKLNSNVHQFHLIPFISPKWTRYYNASFAFPFNLTVDFLQWLFDIS